MTTLWITYAWADNNHGDVDFIAQELETSGLNVKLDRWSLTSGQRLWDQIQHFIADETGCDAWLIVATENSLASEPCKEELAYALDRTLSKRGAGFPVMALFPGSVEDSLIPPAVRVRLYVSIKDPDWMERIISGAKGLPPNIDRPVIEPYEVLVHPRKSPTANILIEVRPRAGVWAPFVIAVPLGEKDALSPQRFRGPRGGVPHGCGGFRTMSWEEESKCGRWWLMRSQDEATPTQSYYLICSELPSKILFGVYNGVPQYEVEIPQTLK